MIALSCSATSARVQSFMVLSSANDTPSPFKVPLSLWCKTVSLLVQMMQICLALLQLQILEAQCRKTRASFLGRADLHRPQPPRPQSEVPAHWMVKPCLSASQAGQAICSALLQAQIRYLPAMAPWQAALDLLWQILAHLPSLLQLQVRSLTQQCVYLYMKYCASVLAHRFRSGIL